MIAPLDSEAWMTRGASVGVMVGVGVAVAVGSGVLVGVRVRVGVRVTVGVWLGKGVWVGGKASCEMTALPIPLVRNKAMMTDKTMLVANEYPNTVRGCKPVMSRVNKPARADHARKTRKTINPSGKR